VSAYICTEERAKGRAWGLGTIEKFHTHGTPIVDPETPT
jgi:catechol 2,3-dioxygenase